MAKRAKTQYIANLPKSAYTDAYEEFADLFAQQTEQDFNTALSQQINSLLQLKNEFTLLNSAMDLYRSYVKQLIESGMKQDPAKIQIQQQHPQIYNNVIKRQQKVFQLGVRGYEIINGIRKFFTGETITYRVGAYGQMGGVKNAKIIEGVVPYEEMRKKFKIQFRLDDGYVITNYITQEWVQSIADDFSLSYLGEEHSTLWSRLLNWVYDPKDPKSINWGNFYELYRLLYTRSKMKNRYRPSAKTIEKAWRQVKANTASFAQGGDVGTEQVKASGSRLTKVSTVMNQLGNLIEGLKAIRDQGYDVGMKKITEILVNQNPADKIQKVEAAEATAAIEQKFKQLGFRITA